MFASYGLLLLIGKFIFLGLVYLFLYWAFRSLFAHIAASEKTAPGRVRQSASSPEAGPQAAGQAGTGAPRQSALPLPSSVPAEAPAASVERSESDMPRQKPVATLIVQDPGLSNLRTGQIIPLTAAVTIGRAADNGLVIQDRYCSSHHALIFLQQGRRLLRDRQSTNGTYHNGQLITGDVVLQDGDMIQIGTVKFQYSAPQ